MESVTLETLLKQLNSNDPVVVAGGLNQLMKKTPNEEFKKVVKLLDIIQLFSSSTNIGCYNVASYLPDLLTKKSILFDQTIIQALSPKNCGGCLLCLLLIIIKLIPSLEGKFYSFIINYLGDYDGKIFEKKSFNTFAQRIYESIDLDSSKKEDLCQKMNEGPFKDYILGMGRLITDDKFIEVSRNNSKEANEIIETHIKQKDKFDYEEAGEILKIISERSAKTEQ